MYKHMIPIMAIVKKWRGKICLAFLFRVSLDVDVETFKITSLCNILQILTAVEMTILADFFPSFCRSKHR